MSLTVNEQANHHRAPYSEYCTMVPGEGLATQFDYTQGGSRGREEGR